MVENVKKTLHQLLRSKSKTPKILRSFQGLFWIFVLVFMGILAGYYGGHIAGYFLSDRFSLTQMTPSPTLPDATIYPVPDQIESLFNHEFSYFGKGSQCYVFLSHDQQHVLKFIRHGRYRLWLSSYRFLPSFLKTSLEEKKKEKEHKLRALFESCLLAEKELKEESEIEWLHLIPTDTPFFTVTLRDKLGRSYKLALNEYSFILQKRGELVFPYLDHLLEQEALEQIKEAISSLFSLLTMRLQRGIADEDPSIIKNAGFLDGEAFFIDIGQFHHLDSSEIDKKAVIKYLLEPVERWVGKNCPTLLPFYEKKLQEI